MPYAPWLRDVMTRQCCQKPKCPCHDVEILLDSKSEPKTIGEVKTAKLKCLGTIASDTINLVERRINYASAVCLKAAMQRVYEPHDDMIHILATRHDVSEAAVSLSADIANVLYPFLRIKAVNANARVAFWREHASWVDVPLPLLKFLQAKQISQKHTLKTKMGIICF